jgi:hypothetical protein
MKRLVAVLAVALVALSTYAVTAPAGPQAVSPRQFNALVRRVAKDEKTISNLTRQLTCIRTFAALTIYGIPSQGVGYVYQPSPGSLVVTTAVDQTEAGGSPSFRVPIINPSCATSRTFVQKVVPTRPLPHP